MALGGAQDEHSPVVEVAAHKQVQTNRMLAGEEVGCYQTVGVGE